MDEKGNEIAGNDVAGMLVVKRPWPSMARSVHGDHERFLNTYLKAPPTHMLWSLSSLLLCG